MEETDHPEKRKFKFTHDEGDDIYNDGAPGKKKHTLSFNSQEFTFNVSIAGPAEKLNFLFSKQGDNMTDILTKSNCVVGYDSSSPHDQKVILSGMPHDLSKALNIIASIISSNDPASSAEKVFVEIPLSPQAVVLDIDNENSKAIIAIEKKITRPDLLCPKSKVGSIIGQKGATVNEIFRRTGCRVQVTQDGIPDDQDRIGITFTFYALYYNNDQVFQYLVEFTGTESQIAEAKKLVEGIVEHGPIYLGKSFSNQSGLIREEFDIPRSKVGGIIGTKGSVISEIMVRSGSKIQIGYYKSIRSEVNIL
jgi:hypothetical protein